MRDQVVTGDAQLCQRDLSAAVVMGGDDFWAMKDSLPTLREDIATLFADPPRGEGIAPHVSRPRHGDRTEVCPLGLGGAERLPGLAAHRSGLPRWSGESLAKGRTTRESACAITCLVSARATAARLQQLWRGHWGSENRPH